MSKFVTIPTYENPFVVYVNGKKYSYEAGANVLVPDEVAFVIETHYDYYDEKTGQRKNTGMYVGEPAEDDIPKVFINGAIPSKKTDMLAEMRYVSATEDFTAYLIIKCQGTSSLQYPKKNFTIKMYSDEARETKLKKAFKDWGHETNKYVLKANYVDHTHARNIVCANLWDEVVSSRADYSALPSEMRNSPRNGAVDGFPVKVYTNGKYQGIYTWNIGKDDWMYGMDEDNANHVLLCAEFNDASVQNPCFFTALWDGTDTYWSVEVGTYSEAVKSSLNNIIACVKDTDDETFRKTIGNYIDVQSAIDYAIHQTVILGKDGVAKNMLLATYDGVKWYCGAYDMDLVFGQKLDFDMADSPADVWVGWNNNLLFNRIRTVFADMVIQRHQALRKTIYSKQNMINKLEQFTDTISNDLYEEDLEIYPNIPTLVGSTKHIREFVCEREWYADREIESPKYTFADGSHTFTEGHSVTVTNGAEICVRTPSDNWSELTGSINISNVSQNTDSVDGDNHWHRPEIFKLHAGDVVRVVFEVDNTKITDMVDTLKYVHDLYGGVFLAASDVETTKYNRKEIIGGEVGGYGLPFGDNTFTVNADFSVGAIFAQLNRSINFKLKIYVNGVRYV